jgi:hypothetical protein
MALFTEFFVFASRVLSYYRVRRINHKCGLRLAVVGNPRVAFSLVSQYVSSLFPRIVWLGSPPTPSDRPQGREEPQAEELPEAAMRNRSRKKQGGEGNTGQ